jgi:hypothetical protein
MTIQRNFLPGLDRKVVAGAVEYDCGQINVAYVRRRREGWTCMVSPRIGQDARRAGGFHAHVADANNELDALVANRVDCGDYR